MRLVCPNCEAKYEVPEDAIPETGRDVQCANCGHSWYQMRPRAAVAEGGPVAPPVVAPEVTPLVAATPDPAPVMDPGPVPVPEAMPEPVPESMPEPVLDTQEPEVTAEGEPVVPEVVVPEVIAAQDDVVSVTGDDTVEAATAEVVVPADDAAEVGTARVDEMLVGAETAVETTSLPVMDAAAEAVQTRETLDDAEDDAGDNAGDDLSPAAMGVAPAAYAVDDSVLAILREEAERESSARRAEAAKPLEVQSDLGIDAAGSMTRKPVEVISVDDSPAVLAQEGDDKLAGRRSRLPDVEEINSTLRPDEQAMMDGTGAGMPVPAETRSSFRSGFLLVMTVAILGMALYISADALGQAVPALAGVLEGYVSFVDSLRLRLDGLMQSATVAINGTGA